MRQESIGGGRLIFSLQPCLSATNFFPPNPSMNSVQAVDKVRTIMIHSPFKSLSVDNQALIHEGHFSLDLNCSHVESYTGTVLLPRVHGIYWISPKAMYSTKLKVYSAVFTVSQSGCREDLPPISSSFLLPHSYLWYCTKSALLWKTAPVYGALKPFFSFLHSTRLCVWVICIPLLIAFLYEACSPEHLIKHVLS